MLLTQELVKHEPRKKLGGLVSGTAVWTELEVIKAANMARKSTMMSHSESLDVGFDASC